MESQATACPLPSLRQRLLLDQYAEKLKRPLQAFAQLNLRLPAQQRLRAADVRPPPRRIVGRQRLLHHVQLDARDLRDDRGEFADREFTRVADVDDVPAQAVERDEAEDAVDQIVDVAEAARLAPIAVDGERVAVQGRHREVGDHASVVGLHAWTIRVEDADDASIEAVNACCRGEIGFGESFALIVAGALTYRVDVAPIALALRVLERVTVALGGGEQKDARSARLRERDRLDRTERVDVQCPERIASVVDGACRRCGMHDAIGWPRHRLGRIDPGCPRRANVGFDEVKRWRTLECGEIATIAGDEVVDSDDRVPRRYEAFRKVRCEKAGSSGMIHDHAALRFRAFAPELRFLLILIEREAPGFRGTVEVATVRREDGDFGGVLPGRKPGRWDGHRGKPDAAKRRICKRDRDVRSILPIEAGQIVGDPAIDDEDGIGRRLMGCRRNPPLREDRGAHGKAILPFGIRVSTAREGVE